MLQRKNLSEISGIGPRIGESVLFLFCKRAACGRIPKTFNRIGDKLKEEESKEAQIFENMNFVITGSVNICNRNEVKAVLKVKRRKKKTGSVTSKTNYLINK